MLMQRRWFSEYQSDDNTALSMETETDFGWDQDEIEQTEDENGTEIVFHQKQMEEVLLRRHHLLISSWIYGCNR